MRTRWRFWILLVFLFLGGLPVQRAVAQESAPAVVVLRFEGVIHPVMQEHLKRALQIAEREGAGAVIIELDTPGGSIDLMNSLVQQIRGSQIPIIVYVTPRGAMAASAGTFITLAGHLSAMAPETTIGAASPVGSEGEDLGETMESKEKEVLKATVRTLTTNRPIEAQQLAESMIQDARAVSVDEALKIGLIDFKASSLEDLLRQLDGRTAQVQNELILLHTSGARVVAVGRTFMEDLLTVLANPNIAFLLLAIGVQAILIEISSPGGWIAGFTGVVCLLLAIYGMGLLPVNWFGILFLVVAFILFILDIKAPTHGALTVGGIVSFVFGLYLLYNTSDIPVPWPSIVVSALATGAFFAFVVTKALMIQRRPAVGGMTGMAGQVGVVRRPLEPQGMVLVNGELWKAESESGPLAAGEPVVVTRQDGFVLWVRRT